MNPEPAYEYPDNYQFQPQQAEYAYTPPPPEKKSIPPIAWVAIGLALVGVVVIVVLLVTGWFPGINTASREQQLHDWRETISPDLRSTADTMDLIGTSADMGDITGLGAACVILEADIDKLRAYLPTPDEKLTKEFTEALDNYDSAAVLCQNPQSEADLIASGHYLQEGNTHITLATDILNEADAELAKQEK